MTLEHNPFTDPLKYRQIIRNSVSIKPKTLFDGKPTIFLFPTKYCPIGCHHCYFSKLIDRKSKRLTHTDEDINRIIKFINSANTENFFVSGGGDPFFALKHVKKIIRLSTADNITIITSGYWAGSAERAQRFISKIHDVYLKNGRSKICLRISVDGYHARGIALSNVVNIINTFQKKYASEGSFSLMVHGFFGDSTIGELKGMLPISQIRVHSDASETVVLKNSYSFDVEYSELVYPDIEIDLNNNETVERNIAVFDKRSLRKRYSKGIYSSGLCRDKAGNLGIDYLINHEGEIEAWGATAPDNIQKINGLSAAEIKIHLLSDVVTLSLLEKGNLYFESIINEINPLAVIRAKAVNITDYYCRLALNEVKTNLYYCLRVIQDYLMENRINLSVLPGEIKKYVCLDKKKLVTLYHQSEYNIASQHLESNGLSSNLDIDTFVSLYKKVRLGHYKISITDLNKAFYETRVLSTKEKSVLCNMISKEPLSLERSLSSIGNSSIKELYKN